MLIGVLDVISNKIDNSYYSKILNPIKASIGAQSVACWAEELGHRVRYISFTGNENINEILNQEFDVLFISSYTFSIYIAIAISAHYRKKGTITALGGPHARGFSKESIPYFDYIFGFCDKQLIDEFLSTSHPKETGLFISNESQPNELPSIQQRWKYIVYNYKKIPRWVRFPNIIPGITSTGCPFSCNFCVDSTIKYKSFDLEQLSEDLEFINLKTNGRGTGILFYDPNLGVGLKKRIEVIKRYSKGTIKFFGEMNLTTLLEDTVKELADIGFYAVAPGIESWSSYDNKSIQSSCGSKINKVYKTAGQVNMVSRHIPLVQANMIFGLDCDSGEEQFSLTKEFIKQCPQAITNFQTLTAFGASPLCKEMEDEDRLLNIPYFLIDGYSSSNIKLKCNLSDFYYNYSDMAKYANSLSVYFKKLSHSKKYQLSLFYTIRQLAGDRGSYKYYKQLGNAMTTSEFASFYCGESKVPPKLYHKILKKQLGVLYSLLPQTVIDYFEGRIYE